MDYNFMLFKDIMRNYKGGQSPDFLETLATATQSKKGN